MRKTPFVWCEGRVIPDPSLINKIHLPFRVILQWLDINFPPGSLRYEIMVARAYDNANGTTTSDEFANFDVESDLPWT